MSTLTGFKVYTTFLAVKQHFTNKTYDFHKYSGKTNASMASYMKRKDRFFFEKIARNVPESNLIDHIVGNVVYGETGLDINPETTWIGILASPEGTNRATKYMARKQSLEYRLRMDLTAITEHANMLDDEVFEKPDEQFPSLLILYYEGKISPETLIILDAVMGGETFDFWDNDRLKGDPLWSKTGSFLRKYRSLALPTLQNDIPKYRKIFMRHAKKADDL